MPSTCRQPCLYFVFHSLLLWVKPERRFTASLCRSESFWGLTFETVGLPTSKWIRQKVQFWQFLTQITLIFNARLQDQCLSSFTELLFPCRIMAFWLFLHTFRRQFLEIVTSIELHWTRLLEKTSKGYLVENFGRFSLKLPSVDPNQRSVIRPWIVNLNAYLMVAMVVPFQQNQVANLFGGV